MHTHSLAIVTDSTVALPSHLIRDLPIFIAPFEIHHEGKVYFDGRDLSPAEFYELQRVSRNLPATSAPQPSAFLKAFELAAGSTDQIICLTLSANMSAAHSSALIAQEEAKILLPSVNVHVLDSRTAGPSMGLMALTAAQEAVADVPIESILNHLYTNIKHNYLLAYVETLYYIWRSGRVPKVAFWLGDILKVKPILEFSNGIVRLLERPRSQHKAMNRLEDLIRRYVRNRNPKIAVVHANAPLKAEELAERITKIFDWPELFITEFTPVIGAHTGPGLVGCAIQLRHDEI
jgi:DegV family protein with EDD domain